jgi:hypothetical protein
MELWFEGDIIEFWERIMQESETNKSLSVGSLVESVIIAECGRAHVQVLRDRCGVDGLTKGGSFERKTEHIPTF